MGNGCGRFRHYSGWALGASASQATNRQATWREANGTNEEDDASEMRNWIRKNMVSDPPSILRENRERAAKFVGVAADGAVAVRSTETWTARDRIAAYFVGKQYAAAAGFAQDAVVENQELVANLGIPDNTVAPRVKELRDGHVINSVGNGRHVLPPSGVKRVLDD